MPPLNTLEKTCLSLAIGHLAIIHTQAANLNVNVATDNLTTTSGNNCTLRKAIESINIQALRPGCQNTGGAFGNTDTIVIDSALANNTITLQGAGFQVGDNENAITNITIQGNGITLNADNKSGAFRIRDGNSLNIDNISIINGQASNDGGAVLIDANASMILTNSVLSHNETNGSGGAIYVSSNASLTAINSSLSYNEAYRNGGGIRATGAHIILSNTSVLHNTAPSTGGIQAGGGSIVDLQDCVISNNTAASVGSSAATFNNSYVSIKNCIISNNTGRSTLRVYGGATALIEQSSIYANRTSSGQPTISVSGGEYSNTSVVIANSTISSNPNSEGLRISGNNGDPDSVSVRLNNVTMTNNDSNRDHNLSIASGSVSIQNSVIASNNIGNACSISGNSIFSSDSNSIIQNSNCGGLARAVNPLLGPLADNGGPSLTHALLSDSPAINTGNNATCEATDQRGETRPLSSTNQCDVGAFESETSDSSLDINTFIIPLPNGRSVIFDL